MSIGVISLSTSQKREIVPQPGPPFTSDSAHNGLSVDTAGKIVLGNDVGDPGAPAQLLNDREIITEDVLFNLFAVILNSAFSLIQTRLTGQTIEMIGAPNTSPLISMLTSGAVSNNQIELDNSGGGANTVLLNNLVGNNAVNLITTGGRNSVILARTTGGGLAQFRIQSVPDSLEIMARGAGLIDFQINNVNPVWRIETATFRTQFGPTLVAMNGADVQISGTTTKRLFPESHAAGTYAIDRDLDSGKIFRNSGALVLTLPGMVGSDFRPGFYFDVLCNDVSGVTLNAGAGVTIRFGDLSTSVNGTISTTSVGACMRIVIIDSTTYAACFFIGAWSLT
jgi:hypothetical protein